MDATTEFRSQPGLRRVLEALKSTTAEGPVFHRRRSPTPIQQRGMDHHTDILATGPLAQPEGAGTLQRLARIVTVQNRGNRRPEAKSVPALQDSAVGVTPAATRNAGQSDSDQCKLTESEAVRPPNTCAERRLGDVVYLADIRKRFVHNDEPSDPPPGAAAARSYKFTFLRAVATP
jgi:hypothetical protein